MNALRSGCSANATGGSPWCVVTYPHGSSATRRTSNADAWRHCDPHAKSIADRTLPANHAATDRGMGWKEGGGGVTETTAGKLRWLVVLVEI